MFGITYTYELSHICFQTPRFPCCTARCYLEEDIGKDIDQRSYLKFRPEAISTLDRDYKVTNWNSPLTEKPREYEVDEKFTEKIDSILEPLQYLQYGESGYKIAENCKCFRMIRCHYKYPDVKIFLTHSIYQKSANFLSILLILFLFLFSASY
jgi:hypothetical protein